MYKHDWLLVVDGWGIDNRFDLIVRLAREPGGSTEFQVQPRVFVCDQVGNYSTSFGGGCQPVPSGIGAKVSGPGEARESINEPIKKPRRLTGALALNAWQCPTFTWGDPTLSSALSVFTSEFGMGSGGTRSLWPPGNSFKNNSGELFFGRPFHSIGNKRQTG